MTEQEILEDIEGAYFSKVAKAFHNNIKASIALSLISQQLTDDLFNFIEPAFIGII